MSGYSSRSVKEDILAKVRTYAIQNNLGGKGTFNAAIDCLLQELEELRQERDDLRKLNENLQNYIKLLNEEQDK